MEKASGVNSINTLGNITFRDNKFLCLPTDLYFLGYIVEMYSRLIYCTLSIGIKAPSVVVGGSLVNIDSMLKFCFASVTHVLA